MANFTAQQANDAYTAIPSDGIKKRINDSDNTKGSRLICFTLNNVPYQVKLSHTEVAMNASAQEVKDAFINKLETEYKYITAIPTYTESDEAKV